MGNSNSAESTLEAAAGAAGPHVTAAFELLSNEIRLAILLALWEAYDPYGPNKAVPFSDVYDSVAITDSANFTYHLDKLTDHFVEKTADGYRLRNAGLMIVRAIIAGTGLDESHVSPTELGISCHRCGDGRVEIRYQDEAVYLTCLECDGFTTTDEYPRGTIAKFWLDPAGQAERNPPELLAASVIRTHHRNRMMEEGICPACSGEIDASLQLCEGHQPGPGTVCPACGTRDSARVRYVCTVCKYRNRRPVELTVVDHPTVIAFYSDHDIDPRLSIDDVQGAIEMLKRLWEMEHTLVSTDPVRIRVTVPCDGDKLHLTLDSDRTVLDVRESD